MDLLFEVRSAARSLRRQPGFAAACVLVLAAGIGAACAEFALVDAALLRPLPFRDPDRLVWIWSTRTDRAKAFFSLPNLADTQAQARAAQVVKFKSARHAGRSAMLRPGSTSRAEENRGCAAMSEVY